MIDLLKNYRELSNAPGYVGSLRYFLAKKKLDTLFIKWLATNKGKVDELFKKAKSGKLKPTDQPNPLFSHHRVPTQNNSMTSSSINFNNGVNPPRASLQFPSTISKKQPLQTQQLAKSDIFTKSVKKQINSEIIPQFYFPQGKPIEQVTDAAYKSQINSIFANKMETDIQGCKRLVEDVMGLPRFFSVFVLSRTANENKITKFQFNRMWKQFQSKSLEKRAFLLLTSDKNKKSLVTEDFKKLFKQILKTHQGLEFLKQTPQFQEWYSLCVINRMFFMANKKNDYKMSYRQFKNSKILRSLYDIENEPDINKNQDFFSYEDFYVIYIKFWELDSDHDFLLTKEELSKYSGYTLSRKTIDRIFLQVSRKFQHPEKMTFGDFVWFIYSVQDKTSEQSLEYWFKILDLDNNGVIAGYQLQYFYEQQSQRLAYMDGSSNDFNFENIICQMVDLMKPDKNIQFTLEDFLKRKEDCGLFINFLTDLNKLVAFEQRDAYEEKNQKTQHPEWTQWDRFVKPEYKKLESSGENEDVDEILNWDNDQE